MIIEQLDPTGAVVETIILEDAFTHRMNYQRYRIINDEGSFMLTNDNFYQSGWVINDEDMPLIKEKPFKFK